MDVILGSLPLPTGLTVLPPSPVSFIISEACSIDVNEIGNAQIYILDTTLPFYHYQAVQTQSATALRVSVGMHEDFARETWWTHS